jgi:AbrB family looped-hinge helix DNA binding protein
MIKTIKVSSRGQVVIPEDTRDNLNIKEGTRLVMIERDNKIILEKEQEFVEKLKYDERVKEKAGWLMVAEKSMAKLWNNAKDDEIWSKYL